MFDLIAVISGFALDTIEKTGYTGIFVLSLLESAAIPIPSEIVVPFSGFLVSLGRFSFWPVVVLISVANLAGSIILFFIGRSGGRWILEHYGKYILIHSDDLEKGDRWFKRYGTKAVFFGRLLPVVRTFISLPAGIAEMSFYKFSFFTFLGALPWNFVLALIGLKAGENWNLLHEYFRKLDIFILIFVLVLVIFYLLKHLKKTKGYAEKIDSG